MAADASLVALGLSHHTAPVEVRERLALGKEGVREELARLIRGGAAREALLVSTCNRVELYAVPGDDGIDALRDDWTLKAAGGRRGADRLFYTHRGEQAVQHLFRVASSLDSLVLGEPQILGQVKDAVKVADGAGALGAVLNRLTQRTLWVAKQVRTRTDIGRSTVGVGNAGVQLAEQIFSSLDGRRAMLVGTGEMGRQVAAAMVHAGARELVVANRTFERAVELAEAFAGTPIHLGRVPDYLSRVDIVIVATGATRPIIGPQEVQAAIRARRHAPLFLVDLAVPRNVDPAVDKLDSAFVFNVDDLRQVTEKGRQEREVASREAEAFVAREAARFARRLADLGVNERIGHMTQLAEALRADELMRSHKLWESLDDSQRDALDAMTRALVKKVLHRPLMAVREALHEGDASRAEAILTAWDDGEDEPAP